MVAGEFPEDAVKVGVTALSANSRGGAAARAV